MSDEGAAMPESAGSANRSEPGVAAGRGGPPRPALIGLGVIAAIVLLLLAVLLLRPGDDEVGDASPIPTSTAAPGSPEPSGVASPAATAASPEPTASAAPSIRGAWTEAAVVSEPGRRYVVGDLLAWSDGLVAVGTRYEEEGRGVFGPPPPHAGQVWRSTDGTEWSDATPAGTFADVELLHLFEAADGALVVIGNVYGDFDATSRAWETSDGETWTPIELGGLPDDAYVAQVASGARGHVAAAFVGPDAHPLYSADGRTWQPTLDGAAISTVAAGDEGFVASTSIPDQPGAAPQIVASADGLEWFDASTDPIDGGFLASPHGGDWVAVATTFGDDGTISAATWGSANGLDWTPLGVMDLVPGGENGCAEAPAALHGLPTMTLAATVLTFGCSEGALQAAGGSYASVDGATWERLPFGDQAYAAGAAMIGHRVVVATDTRTNQATVIGVTFWISEP